VHAEFQNADQISDSPCTPTQRNSLTDTFASMKVTHRSIRLLVALGDDKPESVDALVLARLQLEGLYTLVPPHRTTAARGSLRQGSVEAAVHPLSPDAGGDEGT
jgi:hypothetical protein